MFWESTLLSWIKINSDGAFSASIGCTSAGGIFQGSSGCPLHAFSISVVVELVFELELRKVICVVDKTVEHDMPTIWLESDSSLVVHLL